MSLPLTKAAVGGFAAYSAAVVLVKLLKKAFSRSQRSNNKNNTDVPMIPKELWSQILNEFVINYPSDKDLLSLSLVNKSTHNFISDLYSRRNASALWITPFRVSPILCHFIRRKNRLASNGVFNGKSNPLYGPWMDNNLLRSPETFWKFLVLLLTRPKWFTFYEAEAPRQKGPTSIIIERHFNRLKPLISGLRILSLTPVLDLILKKFQTGEYAWSNIWNFNILYWRSPFKLVPLIIMLMANQAVEINFQSLNGLWIRTALYFLISALQYGGASVLLPIIVLSMVLIGSQFKQNFASRGEIWSICFFSIIITLILFPSTITLLPYAVYYIFSAYFLANANDLLIPLNFYGGLTATLIGTYLTAMNYI